MALSAVLVLSACGDDGSDPDGGGSGDGAEVAEGMPTASAEFGSDAAIDFPDGDAPDGLQVEVLSEGDGDMVAEGAVLLADYAGHVWGNAEAFDSSFERGAPTPFPLSGVVAGWSQGIPDHPIGSRLLISIPPDLGYGPTGGQPEAGIGAEDTIVFVIDIIDGFNPEDAGPADATSVVDPTEFGVSLDGDLGEPVSPTVEDGAEEPDEPSVEILAEGDGDVLAEGDAVVAAYSATTWDNSMLQSSWPQIDDAATGLELVRVGEGYWQDMLVDVPVGSRVLVTMPGNDESDPVALIADVVWAHQS